MTHIPNAGIPEAGECNLPITRTYPIDAWFRIYTTEDNGVTKDYIDFSDYEGEAQVRAHADSGLLLELEVSFAEPQSDAANKGKVRVQAGADDTAELDARVARWDLRLVDPDGVPRRWLRGSAPISDPVTEEDGS